VLDDKGEETGQHFEDDILQLGRTLALVLLFLLLLGGVFLLSLQLFLLFQQTVNNLIINGQILQVDISSVLKGINLANGGFDLVVKLVRPDALKNSIIVIRQNNVALCI
jgi:hypothetical protein